MSDRRAIDWRTPTPWKGGDGWTVGILRATMPELMAQAAPSLAMLRERRPELGEWPILRETDDLDSFQVAAIFDEEIGPFWLLQRDHSPVEGVEIVADIGTSRDAALAAVSRQLGLGRRAFSWITSYSRYPKPAGAGDSSRDSAEHRPKYGQARDSTEPKRRAEGPSA